MSSEVDKGYSVPASALPAAGKIWPLRLLARLLVLCCALGTMGLVWVPWQQSIRGEGRVIAYAPLERQQAVEAPMEGRVTHWYVQEGDVVERGAPIADLADNDPEILNRLEREQNAARTQVDALGLSIELTEARITSLEAARGSAVANAALRIQIARDRADAAQRSIDAAAAKLSTSELNLARQKKLQDKGLVSKRDLELAELQQRTTTTELEQAHASFRAASAEVAALTADRDKIASANLAGIASTRSSLEKLRSDQAKAEADLVKVEVRFARQRQMQVTAPRAGTILRLLAKQDTEMVKAGDPLVKLVPAAESRAVELFVDGNDAPLVEPGRTVRLQFEGWPAVQFVGWPSVAVGTFPGRVAFVDAHGDDSGRFRVVVVPERAQEWPEGRYLRQGVRANGWVLLNQVRLGYELWRQFNGFPPSVKTPAALDGEGRP